ncbi:Aldo/keto reductase [Schizosaccharomyces pombe]|uniref:Uncharacterized oxidoreductase C215.11c n=1 Tax=Schizosaccharomyces pombe (strain 972 / ATCC 24843) TaxID=284812 RepID=YH5B_SCHPO|nr:aldo/keto reductase family protein [Schizosaccharomyces pombe]O94315.1 RecName: Full=Uncharacterized oxidoreductase C215.11c [Schizosaccharomyces pombe 972h-]CAA22125.1 aldo/keto reductase, unknown biological role [Schizosaccharomyces pombe]|eukprot:NP_596688.1 aldo/keto reductase family protein [Schizosaccharomyces pombe]
MSKTAASSAVDASQAGTVKVGDMVVNRMGFGAMRVTGDGIWDEPKDKEACIATLKRLPELNINFIDTADSYGPEVSENLLREALYPYKGLIIATKGGLVRTGPNEWHPCGAPKFLRQEVLMSMRRLGVKQIDLWQLHRIDPKVPRKDQFSEIAAMKKEGLIRHVGLSEVTVDDIKEAEQYFPVVSVQNLFNLVNRKNEKVLEYCEQKGIAFIPWYPLASGALAKPGTILDAVSKDLDRSTSQIALSWVLQRSPVMLPIPGTSKVDHLEENVKAAGIQLSSEVFAKLDEEGKSEDAKRQEEEKKKSS